MAEHIYDKIVVLQKYDEDIDGYANVSGIPSLHAHINPAGFSTEKYEGKAMQDDVPFDFFLRYNSTLAAIVLRPQLYRILWNGEAFDITGADDYQLQHKEIRLRGVIANGGR